MTIRLGSINGNTIRLGSFEEAVVASISAPATAVSGQTITVAVNNFEGPITLAIFAGVDVSASVSQTGDDVTVDVPEAFANGLPFESLPIEIGDGTDTASTNTVLEPDTTIRFNGLVAGFENETWTDENVFTAFEDSGIIVQDGWHYTVRDPQEHTATFNDDGTFEAAPGDFYVRVFDETDTTDSSYGTWTEEATIAVEEDQTPPSLSLGEEEYAPGSEITGTLTNFTGVPTDTVVMESVSDSQSSVSLSVTWQQVGDDYELVGTIPSLPEMGSSVQLTKFGTVVFRVTGGG